MIYNRLVAEALAMVMMKERIVVMNKDAKRSSMAGVVALALIVAALTASGCSKARATAPPPSPPEVEVVAVEQRDVPLYNEGSGTLEGTGNADIKSPGTGSLL